MKVIIHVLVGDGAIRVDEARVNVEEGGMRERRYSLLDQLVHLGISISHGVWHFAPRQYALEKLIQVKHLKALLQINESLKALNRTILEICM